MLLLTQEIRNQLPPLYTHENTPDPIAIVKFFSPYSNWTWWVWEGSPVDEDGIMIGPGESKKPAVDFLCFGAVQGFEFELGYISLNELEHARGPLGIPGVERDLYFKPIPLSQIRASQNH